MSEQRSFPADLASATAARRFVVDELASWGVDGATEDAALLTTELVQNAIAHARSKATVTVSLGDGRVRVVVLDDSPELPHQADRGPGAPSGRGLMIVDAIAADWGVTATAAGKQVWFEVLAHG